MNVKTDDVELPIDNGQIAKSLSLDFVSRVWSFLMEDGFVGGHGKYLIIKLPKDMDFSEKFSCSLRISRIHD